MLSPDYCGCLYSPLQAAVFQGVLTMYSRGATAHSEPPFPTYTPRHLVIDEHIISSTLVFCGQKGLHSSAVPECVLFPTHVYIFSSFQGDIESTLMMQDNSR